MNIAANLDHAAFHFPDRPAIAAGSESASFSEFNRDANQIASALVSARLHPGIHVALCAPNQKYGEQVTAFIVPRKGYQIDPASLKDYLKAHLTAFKVPKEYITVEDLPKSGAGKVLKREVRKQYNGR